jgi:hypothetical protein
MDVLIVADEELAGEVYLCPASYIKNGAVNRYVF